MFCSTAMLLGLMLGTALESPSTDAAPEIRGPRWQGRAVVTAPVGDEATAATDLREPFALGRSGIAAEHAVDVAGSLRDPFGGRRGVATRRVATDEPIAPASRARTAAPVPTPAAAASDTELTDPFARRRVNAPTPAPASDVGGSLRRPFGAP